MASNFLTDGRQALVAALQADATLDAGVDKWWIWGGGLIQRYDVVPANCPLCTVVPAGLDEDQIANVVRGVGQDVEIGFATADAGHAAEPCEELVAAALEVLNAARDTHLGLYADGLNLIEVLGVRWRAVQSEEAARLIWEAVITVRLHWHLT